LQLVTNSLVVPRWAFAAWGEGVDTEGEEIALADPAPLGGAEFAEALVIGRHGLDASLVILLANH
jgi:hypothetical protein